MCAGPRCTRIARYFRCQHEYPGCKDLFATKVANDKLAWEPCFYSENLGVPVEAMPLPCGYCILTFGGKKFPLQFKHRPARERLAELTPDDIPETYAHREESSTDVSETSYWGTEEEQHLQRMIDGFLCTSLSSEGEGDIRVGRFTYEGIMPDDDDDGGIYVGKFRFDEMMDEDEDDVGENDIHDGTFRYEEVVADNEDDAGQAMMYSYDENSYDENEWELADGLDEGQDEWDDDDEDFAQIYTYDYNEWLRVT